MNLYDILGVPKSATIQEIKQAYRILVKKYHPDKGGQDHINKFHAINTAYTVLNDPSKKAQYDSMGFIDRDDINGDIPYQGNGSIFSELINAFCSKLFSSNTSVFTNLRDDEKFEDLLQKNNMEMATNYVINNLKQHFSVGINDSSDKQKYESELSESDTRYESTDIIINIDTNIEEIYNGLIKIITVDRQILKGKSMIVDKVKFNIPVCNDKMIFENEGNEYLNDDNKLVKSNVIVKVRCLHSNYYKRINTYDIMIMSCVTEDELDNGYNKTLKYFDKTITLKCKNPREKLSKNKIITKISGCGIKYYENDNYKNPLYGNLIVVLFKQK